MDEAQLRRIIREEIADALKSLESSADRYTSQGSFDGDSEYAAAHVLSNVVGNVVHERGGTDG